jgi:hypothetical protein
LIFLLLFPSAETPLVFFKLSTSDFFSGLTAIL